MACICVGMGSGCLHTYFQYTSSLIYTLYKTGREKDLREKRTTTIKGYEPMNNMTFGNKVLSFSRFSRASQPPGEIN